jgi:lysophospholipase L1-like esterase
MKSFFKHLNDLWIIAGITILLLIFIELAFSVYYNTASAVDPRAEADCYPKEEWVQDLYREFSASGHESWHPYVYWRRKPFSGKYINIGEDGLRKSLYSIQDSVSTAPAVRLFFMGGSTLWGTGVRDEYTIPSLTGEMLSQKGFYPEVFNFGESGYVNTQELVALMVELQKGNIPDIVVFYDGVNDVFSAFQQNEAGIPQNEYNRQAEFNAFRGKKNLVRSLFRAAPSFSTVRFISEKVNRKKDFSSTYSPAESESLSSAVASHYWSNLRMTESLAKEYGFKTVYYLQPAIFHKNHLTPYELMQFEEMKYLKPFIGQAYRKTSDAEGKPAGIDFQNISDIFMDIQAPLFIDWCHIGESGNLIIAERITGDLVPVCMEVQKKRTKLERKDQANH